MSARKVVELLALVVVQAEEVIQGVCILVSKGMVASYFRGVDYHRCRLEVCQRFPACSSRSDCNIDVAVATEVGVVEKEVGGKDKTALRQACKPSFSFILLDPSPELQVPEIECFQERSYIQFAFFLSPLLEELSGVVRNGKFFRVFRPILRKPARLRRVRTTLKRSFFHGISAFCEKSR